MMQAIREQNLDADRVGGLSDDGKVPGKGR